MPMCLTCSGWGNQHLCTTCRSSLRRPDRVIIGALTVCSGLVHEGAARRLVHLLKYQGVDLAAVVLARVMACALPVDATAIVPVPRALVRRLRYGVDPARRLARLIGQETGVPFVDGLAAPVWWPCHAGSSRAARRMPRFRLVTTVPTGSVLVDDVLTTGATVSAAAQVAGSNRVLTATRADSESFG